jgi:hypothetical protein
MAPIMLITALCELDDTTNKHATHASKCESDFGYGRVLFFLWAPLLAITKS